MALSLKTSLELALVFDKGLKTRKLKIQLSAKGLILRAFVLESDICVELSAFYAQVGPTNNLIHPQKRHGVVSANPFCRRRIGLKGISPAPKMFEALTVPNQRIEWRQNADLAKFFR